MRRRVIFRAVCAASLGLSQLILMGCPASEPSEISQKAAVTTKVEGIAVAPIAQLMTVAPLTTVAPLQQATGYQTLGLEALGEQGYVPNARVTVLDGDLQPIADIKPGKTDDKGKFSLQLPPGRSFILRLEFGESKKLTLFCFVKLGHSGVGSLRLDVPSTLAAHLLLRKIAQQPGLLNEFSSEEIETIKEEIGSHLTPADVPDLTQITSILDRVGKLEARLAALETKVSELEKKVDGLLNPGGGASPAPSPSPTPTPIPSASPRAFSLVSSKLMTARFLHASAHYGKYVYVVGGVYQGTALNKVERAELDSTGALSNFSDLPVSLLKARSGHTCHVIGKYLYVVGGVNGKAYFGDVERAEIKADGTLGPFESVTGVTLSTARQAHTSNVIGNYIYVFGGGTATLPAAKTVERSQVNSDGTIGPFSIVSGVSFVEARFTHTTHVSGKYLYAIGGNSGGGGSNRFIERAAINSDGSISTFTTVPGVVLNTPRYDHISQIIGNTLVVIGGWSETGLKNSIEQAVVNSDGSLGSFSIIQGLSQATGRIWATNVLFNNRLYVIGGSPDAVNSLNSIEAIDF